MRCWHISANVAVKFWSVWSAPRRKRCKPSKISVSTAASSIENSGYATTNAIATATERLNASLAFKTENVADEFDMLSQNLMEMMQLRLANVTDDFPPARDHHHRIDGRAVAGSLRAIAGYVIAGCRSHCAAQRRGELGAEGTRAIP